MIDLPVVGERAGILLPGEKHMVALGRAALEGELVDIAAGIDQAGEFQ